MCQSFHWKYKGSKIIIIAIGLMSAYHAGVGQRGFYEWLSNIFVFTGF